MKNEFRLFKINTGEMIVTKIVETLDDGRFVLDYPAMVVPIPPEQAGGMRNQIGFGKFMPFSNYNQDVILNPNSIIADSTADSNIIGAYEQWINHMKAQESGIVMAGSNDLPKEGRAQGFNRLNV